MEINYFPFTASGLGRCTSDGPRVDDELFPGSIQDPDGLNQYGATGPHRSSYGDEYGARQNLARSVERRD